MSYFHESKININDLKEAMVKMSANALKYVYISSLVGDVPYDTW